MRKYAEQGRTNSFTLCKDCEVLRAKLNFLSAAFHSLFTFVQCRLLHSPSFVAIPRDNFSILLVDVHHPPFTLSSDRIPGGRQGGRKDKTTQACLIAEPQSNVLACRDRTTVQRLVFHPPQSAEQVLQKVT